MQVDLSARSGSPKMTILKGGATLALLPHHNFDIFDLAVIIDHRNREGRAP